MTVLRGYNPRVGAAPMGTDGPIRAPTRDRARGTPRLKRTSGRKAWRSTRRSRTGPTPPTAGGRAQAWLTRRARAGGQRVAAITPLRGFDVYVVGFHCPKGEPNLQMEAHHFCRVVNDDLLQCVLFDGNTRDANLIGMEYIVSERLFDSMPEDEKDTGTRTTSSCSRASSPPGAARRRGEGVLRAAGQLLRQDVAHLAHEQPQRSAGHGAAVRGPRADVVVQP